VPAIRERFLVFQTAKRVDSPETESPGSRVHAVTYDLGISFDVFAGTPVQKPSHAKVAAEAALVATIFDAAASAESVPLDSCAITSI